MFGNVAVYIGDKSFEEIINPNCLLYFYSKNEIELEMQKKDIQDCCEKWNKKKRKK